MLWSTPRSIHPFVGASVCFRVTPSRPVVRWTLALVADDLGQERVGRKPGERGSQDGREDRAKKIKP